MNTPIYTGLTLITHFFLWFLLYQHSTGVIMSFDDQGVSVPEAFILNGVMYSMLFNGLLFYLNYSFLVKKYLLVHWKQYSLYGAMAWVLISLMETACDLTQLSTLAQEQQNKAIWVLLIFNLKINGAYWALALIFRIVLDWVQHVQAQKAIATQQLKTELALLKSQVHPHFLFNTLNTLYSSAYQFGDEETAEGIGRLSHLLRYMLYETQGQKVPLKNEVEYLQNYIALQTMRFASEAEIQFSIEGDTDRYEIAPMLLITLVENAFKHGISPAVQSQINIALCIEGEKLTFVVENSLLKKNPASSAQVGGLGLMNLKKRLALIYPETSVFNTRTEHHQFIASLELT